MDGTCRAEQGACTPIPRGTSCSKYPRSPGIYANAGYSFSPVVLAHAPIIEYDIDSINDTLIIRAKYKAHVLDAMNIALVFLNEARNMYT